MAATLNDPRPRSRTSEVGSPSHEVELNSDDSSCSSSASSIEFNTGYVKSVPCLLKITQMVVSVITFSCSLAGSWSTQGGGWVEFVGFCALICSAVWFILHLLKSIRHSTTHYLAEFVSDVIISICYTIAVLVSAIRASWPFQQNRVLIGITACFAFIAAIVYAVDAFFMYKNRKGHSKAPATRKEPPGTAPTIRVVPPTPINDEVYANYPSNNDNSRSATRPYSTSSATGAVLSATAATNNYNRSNSTTSAVASVTATNRPNSITSEADKTANNRPNSTSSAAASALANNNSSKFASANASTRTAQNDSAASDTRGKGRSTFSLEVADSDTYANFDETLNPSRPRVLSAANDKNQTTMSGNSANASRHLANISAQQCVSGARGSATSDMTSSFSGF